ncbi:MAG: carbonic anhydrase [Bryobacteraceae bacterium]
MDRRNFLRVLTSAACAPVSLVAAGGPGGNKPPGPAQVLRELAEGNRRFATNHAKHPHSDAVRVRQTWRQGQHPRAAILCCSDSRVAPEILFDQGIGDLFSIRVAGNVANEDEVASAEYAVAHLDVGLCVVLGHEECGAVSAAVANEPLPPEFDHLLSEVRRARDRTTALYPQLQGPELLKATVRMNVWQAVEDLLRHGPILRERLRANRLAIVGAVYHIENGRVEWLGPHANQRELAG